MALPQSNRSTVLTLLLLALSVIAPLHATGDPSLNDNGNGTKTATWDFSNPANYTVQNVSMAANNLSLRSTPGVWSFSSTADFVANGTHDPAVQVTNGSLRLQGNEANLVADGNFSQAGTWTWTNGSRGAITANQNLGTAEFHHATINNSTQFDSMDTGAGWGPTTSGIGAISTPTLESANKVEG